MTDTQAPKPVRPISRFRIHNDTVYVSGQVPVRAGVIVKDSFEAQVLQTLENVRSAVEDAGSSLGNILKCSCYVRRQEDLDEFNRLYAAFFAGGTFPARTTLIANPPNLDVDVEVEAIAVISPK